jgi:hypothetical protein
MDMDVHQALESGRRELDAGRNKEALRALTGTVFEADADQVRAIRRLAEEGRGTAGLFGRLGWSEIVRLADLRLRTAA